ncbi:MAG: DoxX family protein [Beutenbergiaceae bacterium]
MSPIRAVARVLLATPFILDGIDAIRHPQAHADKAQPVAPLVEKVSERVPVMPSDLKTLTRVIGIKQVVAGLLLASGAAPRLGAATLAIIAVPTTAVRYPVWSTTGEERRANIAGLVRNAALLSGLVFAAEDRVGKPSLGWRFDNWREHQAELSELRSSLKAEVKAAKQAA